MEKAGQMSPDARARAEALGPGATYKQFQEAAGVQTAYALEEKMTRETRKSKFAMRTMAEIQKDYGTEAEGMHLARKLMGKELGGAQAFDPIWMATKKGISAKEFVSQQEKGKVIRTKLAKAVVTDKPGMAKRQAVRKEDLIMEYGAKFAETSIKMDKAMMKLASEAAPAAITGITAVGKATSALAKQIDNLSKRIKKATNEKGEFSMWDFI